MPFRSAQADRWPKAFTPIEIGLSGRCAPGVGLRRREGCSFRSAQADRWPEAFTPIGNRPLRALARRALAFADAKDAFSVGAGRSLAGGFHAD